VNKTCSAQAKSSNHLHPFQILFILLSANEAQKLQLALDAFSEFVQKIGVKNPPLHLGNRGQLPEQVQVIFQVFEEFFAHVGPRRFQDQSCHFRVFVLWRQSYFTIVKRESVFLNHLADRFREIDVRTGVETEGEVIYIPRVQRVMAGGEALEAGV